MIQIGLYEQHEGRTRTPVELRPYQRRAIRALQERLHAGTRRVLIVAPTGAGKGTIAASVMAEHASSGKSVLFVAHRRELISQAHRRLVDMGLPEEEVGVIMGNDRRSRPRAPVQVASIDTLRHREKPKADLVFVDECHRATAKSYRELEKAYPAALHLGLTATPYRANGRGLSDAYDDMVVVASVQELIAEGFLVEPRVLTVRPEDRPDLSKLRITQGDYSQEELGRVMDQHGLVGNIVEHWKRHAEGVRTVVFATTVLHSKHIVSRFRAAGVAAEHVDAGTPPAERDAILARVDSGETLVVSCVQCLSEGWDQPSVKCGILARPTKSMGLYLQQAGRILRPWNGVGALLLDHAGCALEHGLPQDERAFSLEGRPQAPPRTTKACKSCWAVVPFKAHACADCGHVFGVAPPAQLSMGTAAVVVPSERSGWLTDASQIDLKKAYWDRLCAEREKRNFGRGWVFFRFRERFGEPPPKDFVMPVRKGDAAREVFKHVRSAVRQGGFLNMQKVHQLVRVNSGQEGTETTA